jgi:hypothetical protein
MSHPRRKKATPPAKPPIKVLLFVILFVFKKLFLLVRLFGNAPFFKVVSGLH